jgi:hypothetical protein
MKIHVTKGRITEFLAKAVIVTHFERSEPISFYAHQ